MLSSNAAGVVLSPAQIATGWHTVADLTCMICQTKIGWKYVDAKEASQKYKVGKFILEVERVTCYKSWEDEELLPLTPRGSQHSHTHPRDEAGKKRRGKADALYGFRKGPEDKFGEGILEDGEEDDGHEREDGEEEEEEEEVEFDSEDEDECDAIFAGTWDREVVRKRRNNSSKKKRAVCAALASSSGPSAS